MRRPVAREWLCRLTGRATVLVLVLTVGSLALAAAAAGQRKHATADSVVVAIEGVTSLDDSVSATAGNIMVTENVLQPLYGFSSQGKVIPVLATSVSRPNKVTYIYHLRKGVKFTNGRPLTAADVVATFKYLERPKSSISFFFSGVASIAANGTDEVVVKLKQPNATWQDLVAESVGVMPASWLAAHPDWGQLGGPGVVGTGPYKLVSSSSQKLTFVRNDNYWGPKPQIKNATVVINIANADAESLAMRAGKIDLAFPETNVNQLYAGASGIKITTVPSCQLTALALNTHKAPWSDIHVRRAVAYVVDRNAIVQGVLGGDGQPVTSLMFPEMWAGLLSPAQAAKIQTPAYPQNLAKAKAEMAQSSVPNGFSDSTVVPSGSSWEKAAEILVPQLAQIGIHLTVNSVPEDQWLTQWYYGARDLKGIFVQPGICEFTDPSYFPSYWTDSKNALNNTFNQADFIDRQANVWMNDLISAQQPKARIRYGENLLHLLQTRLPYIGLYTTDLQAVVRAPYVFHGMSNWIYEQPFLTDITSG